MELKNYINRVLGDNIRCILPSYWWKRIFGLILDKIDEVSKSIGNTTPDMSNVQEKLVSGVNIKTVNNESILGEGNIEISAESDYINFETIHSSPNQILSIINKVRNNEVPKIFKNFDNKNMVIASKFIILEEVNTFLIYFGDDYMAYGYDLDTGSANVEKYIYDTIVITTNDSTYLTRNQIIYYLIRSQYIREYTCKITPVSFNNIYIPIYCRNYNFTILEEGVATTYVLNQDGTVTKQS
jgi:hypothetical protein